MSLKHRNTTRAGLLSKRYLVRANANSGFMLIELLIVIIVAGVLAAIALPSFLNQAGKAKQSEAKTFQAATLVPQQNLIIFSPLLQALQFAIR